MFHRSRSRSPSCSVRSRGLAVVLLLALMAAGCDDPTGDGGREGRTITVPVQPGETPDGGGPDLADLAGGDDCDGAETVPGDDNRREAERATLCLVNAERTKRDREPLEDDVALTRAARAKARDMVRKEYFAHVGPDGRDVRDWVRDTDYLDGVTGHRLGENLGWASEGAATPAQLVTQWMESRSHRENLLRRAFRDSGIGIVLGAPQESGGGATYVHMFGRR